DRGRGDLGILRHRQAELGDAAHDQDDDRQDRREDRPVDEEMGKTHGLGFELGWLGLLSPGAGLPLASLGMIGSHYLALASAVWISPFCGLTLAPGRTIGLARPSSTTLSVAAGPPAATGRAGAGG